MVRLIARDGLETVTTRRITSVAGYSNGSLLYYFSSKEEAIRAAYEFVFAATNKRAAASERQTNSSLARCSRNFIWPAPRHGRYLTLQR